MNNEDNIFELRTRGFDFIRGGNSASYILRVYQDHEEKIKELEAKLDQQRFNNEHNLSIDQTVADRIKELEAKLVEATKALEFYGNIESWRKIGSKEFAILDSEDGSDFEMIKGGFKVVGRRARSALEKLKAP